MPPWGPERSPGPVTATVIIIVAVVAILAAILLKFGAATGVH